MGLMEAQYAQAGKNSPTPPDFTKAAEAQGASARPNQNGPFGSVQWTQGPDGKWTQNASLNPQLSQAASGLEAQAAQNASTPMMTGEDARKQAIDSAYGQASSRLDPQWSQREEQQKSQLIAQGLDPSSEAYQREMGNFERSRNDAYTSAMNSAIGQGTAAQQATFNENLASRELPYTQLGQLQGLATPLSPGPATQYLPAAMAAYQGALQTYGIQQAGKNSAMGGGAQAAALAAG